MSIKIEFKDTLKTKIKSIVEVDDSGNQIGLEVKFRSSSNNRYVIEIFDSKNECVDIFTDTQGVTYDPTTVFNTTMVGITDIATKVYSNRKDGVEVKVISRRLENGSVKKNIYYNDELVCVSEYKPVDGKMIHTVLADTRESYMNSLSLS